MNKKTKWAIPFAVLALTCGIAAGCGGGHKHSYTEWAHNETQHWKECPDDHEKDEGTFADHVFDDDGVCVCGVTEQVAPVTDVTITNGTTDTNGTVTLSKTTAKAGDSVTVTVAPNDGYQLESLTVNGANVFGAMTGNTYEFRVSENTTVVAVFKKIASSSVNAQITGKKYGITGNSLEAGTTVTLSATDREDVTATITADGKIVVDEIAGDNWKVKVDGYVTAEIMIPRDTEYTTAISLEYDLMENLNISWGNSDQQDLSAQNDGKVTHSSGYYQWVSTKDSYDSVAITANVVKGGYRQGVFIRFKGDTYADDGFVMLEKEHQDKICICGAGDGYTGKNLWKDNWDNYLGSDRSNSLMNDEYELTLVRDGANIYIFIDGEYTATKALPEGYADKECYVGLFCTDATSMENSERTFRIGTYNDFFKAVTITDATETDANGSLTIPEGEYKVGEQVRITVTPSAGYLLGSLKVNGKEYGDKVVNDTLTLTLTSATVELKASFNSSAFSADNKVCPEGTYDFDSYLINDQLILGYKRYNTANDKPSYGDLIGTGLDDVTRYGNDFNGTTGNIEFKVNGNTNANCLFLDNGVYKDVTVTVPAGATQILVFTGTYDGGEKTITCNLYDENGHCVGNGTFLHTRGDSPRADLITFTVDKTKIGEGGTYTLRIGGNCSTTVAAIVVLGEKHDVTITDGTTDTNGTVTIDKTTATTGDKVTVTLTPSATYRISDLKVDGKSVLASIVDNTYTFVALKNTTVVTEFEKLQLVDVTLTMKATDFADRDVTLADGTQITFRNAKGLGDEYTYTVGAENNFTQMYAGEYIATCEGYFETTVMVQADNGAVTVNFSQPIATTQSNEITIKEDKTIAIKGNGVADRTGNRQISADLKMTDEQINSTGLTLEFTARVTKKYRNGDDWAASRFGVQIGEGAVGFFVFIRDNGTNKADVVKLQANSLDLNPGSGEQKWHGDDPDLTWLTLAALSADGLQMKVVRVNGVIHIYAKNGENWVLLDTQEATNGEGNNSGGDLTIANTVKNRIKLIATGDDWEFSGIRITLPEETEKAALTASVDNEEHGSIATDIQSYYKGDKAVITVTAVKGYQLDKLVIGNTEVTEGWTKEGLVYTYELTLEGDTTVVANIIETPIPQVTPNITVSGAKYGSTETPDIAEGLEITLTNEDMETEYKGTVDANGKITFEKQLYVATYTVTAQGYFSTTVTITEDTAEAIELTLYVETVDCEITVGETGDTAKFVAEGATVTFSKDGVTKTVMVTDGKVKLEDVLTGNWVTTANFGGYEIDLGWTTVDKSGTASITVDADGIMWSKAEKPIVSSDIAEGTVEIVTNVAYHNKIKLATQKEGGALAFRLALPDSVDTTGNFRTAMSMPITFADGNMVFVFFAEKNGETNTIKLGYTSVNGGEWWDDADRLNLSAQWETFIDGGLWIVVDVNANTSLVRTYVGATLETAVNANYDRTYKGNSKQLTAFEIGNGGYEKDDSNRNILVTFKYGETLEALKTEGDSQSSDTPAQD